MFKNRKPGKAGGKKKPAGGAPRGMPPGMAGIPPEMMAAFGMGMGMDDDDFDDEDFDEEDLDSMEAEFASFGGGGGGGGRGSAKKEAKKSKRCHYEVLGIERDATTDQIKKAFRINAVKHHPDKGGDPELFKLMSEAYAVLSDDSKRARYDRYGHEDDDGAGHHDEPADNRRVRPVNVSLTVTLGEVYNGCTKRVRVQRQRLCDPCKGTGAKDPSKGASQCGQCRGRGVMLARTIMGMMQMECDACDGSGQSIAARDRCPSCRGEKIGEQTATLNVEIPRGAADGQRLVLSGEGHAVPGITAGDVAVLLTIEKHETMTRHGDILVVDQQVTLRDALCGGSFEFTHLDGRKLRIVSKRGETIQPGSLKCVENEGMPKLSNSFFKGHLVFRFSVVFPQHMDEASIASLEAMLPAVAKKDKTPSKQSEEVEECHLSEFDKAQLEVKPSKSHGHEDDDEDDEHMRARMGGMGGGGAQCRQM